MAWTAPMTAVAGSVFTAAQFNASIRDNLNECPAAKATTPGGYFTVSDTNQVAQRVYGDAIVETSEATTSTTYTALATAGPSVTVTSGPQLIIHTTADLVCNTAGQTARMTFNISGASSIAENDIRALKNTSTTNLRATVTTVMTVTPGVNTVTMVYRTSGTSTATFANRRLIVLPY